MTDEENLTSEAPRRPLVYWLRAVDDVLGDEFARAFAEGDADAYGSVRARIHDAVSPEDLATTVASLEAIARAFGWDDDSRPLRTGPRRRDIGHAPRFGHGSGRRHGFGHGRHHSRHHGGGCGEHGHGHRHAETERVS